MTDSRPFAGIQVVEFGQFIAVPFCGQLLAEGGAYVIKVESLEGDPVRHLAPVAPGETRHFISRNRGKHSLPLDLKHPDARRIIDALLARADVVLFNFRPGLAEELGLDYGTLSARYPRLIVGSVTGFGTRGPDAMLAGMDLVLQARSGLMASNGRVRDGVPSPGRLAHRRLRVRAVARVRDRLGAAATHRHGARRARRGRAAHGGAPGTEQLDGPGGE
ncbi:MAG: hypothetical protein FJZ38_23065 [Candidatus Rokubacteria bacterium]|nr:hypothetical protein [Candidatus Rokubacteria bacterium]